MDFNDTPEEAAYRAKARTWLEAHAPRAEAHANAGLDAARAWQAMKVDAGYACITWPKEWGGPGGSPIESVIFAEEEARHRIPLDPFRIGLGMCVPTVMTFADETTKARIVGPAMRGDEIWCQLFSEPAGGSDVAAARTRAVRDGDAWIIDGQKIWTTGAQMSDFGLILCRTNPEAPKHKGLTMFWLDMKSPGVSVKPIHQMSGGSDFNEVFFDGVRVRDTQRVGPVDDGWRVALVTLMNERLAVGGERGPTWRQFMAAARDIHDGDGRPALNDPAMRERLADWFVLSEGLRHTRSRTVTALSKGQTPGPENSIHKIVSANMMQELTHAAVEMLDQYGLISDPAIAPLAGAFQHALLSAPGFRIAGGTDEILRNILAERVLGMPGDIRLDKDVPFKDLPTGR